MALCWLRGWVEPNPEITKELQEIEKPIKTKTPYREYMKKSFIRPFRLVVLGFLLANFSGTYSLSTFAVDIFASLGSPINKYYSTIMLGGAQIIGTILCACLIHHTGKRRLVLVSCIGTGLLYGSVGFYAHFYAHVYNLDNGSFVQEYFKETKNLFAWVPLVGLVGGSLFAYLAMRPVAWIMVGEVFPTEIRAFASGLAACCFYIFGFLANKSFFGVLDLITLPGYYWFSGSLCLVMAVMYYFILPETEGRTLLEIQEHFEGKIDLIRGKKTKMGKENYAFQE